MGPGTQEGQGERIGKKKQFFFEKKNQKTFVYCHRDQPCWSNQPIGPFSVTNKSFLVLFFKKELLILRPPAPDA
jgi:hypothetical protein